MKLQGDQLRIGGVVRFVDSKPGGNPRPALIVDIVDREDGSRAVWLMDFTTKQLFPDEALIVAVTHTKILQGMSLNQTQTSRMYGDPSCVHLVHESDLPDQRKPGRAGRGVLSKAQAWFRDYMASLETASVEAREEALGDGVTAEEDSVTPE